MSNLSAASLAMLPAVLTAFLFACSGVCGQRSARMLGPLRANAVRLGIAMAVLGLAAWLLAPPRLDSPAVPWLLASGAVGFGAGDIALFLAYPRLGARLTLLINLCLAPVFGAGGEWLLLGETPRLMQAAACGVIMTGVVIALSATQRNAAKAKAERNEPEKSKLAWAGLLFAIAAGTGQGFGATLTRMAKAKAAAAGDTFTGISEAAIRVAPGFLLAVLAWLVFSSGRKAKASPAASRARNGWWVAGAALFGPILGVSCFQWALSSASSGVVLSITATAPILVIPMAAYVDGDKPPPAAVLGSFIAVAGVVLAVLA